MEITVCCIDIGEGGGGGVWFSMGQLLGNPHNSEICVYKAWTITSFVQFVTIITIIIIINPLTAKIFNLNFHPPEVVSR